MKRCYLMCMAALLAMGMLVAQPTRETPAQTAVDLTDDLGRTVTLPAELERVVSSGPLTEYMLTPIAMDQMVGRAITWSEDATAFLSSDYLQKPVTGQLYGGKGTLNPETILGLGAQLVIDVGEQKKNMRTDLDNLQGQLGIPFIHIDATFRTLPEAYAKLGKLLGQEEKAAEISTFITRVTERNARLTEGGKKQALYVLGAKGVNVIAKGSYQADVLDQVIENLAVVEKPTAKGTGNEVDMEQIMQWNPPTLLFAGDAKDVYGKVATDPLWSQLDAVKNQAVYLVPDQPMNWLASPPSINRIAGIIWADKVLYGGDFDLHQELKEYFRLFFDKEMSDETLTALIGF